MNPLFPLGAIACLALTSTAFGQATKAQAVQVTTPEWEQSVVRWAQPLVGDGVVMGMCIGVIQADQTWVKGIGRLAPGSEEAPNATTVYEIGSISKVFTGILLADAENRGLVSREDPVQKFLPEGTVLKERKMPVQLVHLANHTSGWGRMPSNLNPANPNDPYADYDEVQLFEFLAGHKPMWKPGRLSQYSNLGMGTLGHLMAKHQGMTYADLLAARIVTPLGLKSTGVALTEDMQKRMAPPFNADMNSDHVWNFDSLVGAGGIRADMQDMLLFAKAVLSPPEGDIGDAIRASIPVTHSVRGGGGVGLAWQHQTELEEIWHNGQTGGYHSYMVLWPAGGTAVIVLANTASGTLDALGNNLMRELRGHKTTPIEYRKAIQLETSVLKQMVGRYQLAPSVEATVIEDGGSLYVQLTGQSRFKLHASSPTEFFLRVLDAQVSFEGTEDGPASALILHQNGNNSRAPRIAE